MNRPLRYLYHAGRLEVLQLLDVVPNPAGGYTQLAVRGREIAHFTPDSPALRHTTPLAAHTEYLSFLEGEPQTPERTARMAEIRAAIEAETPR